MIPTGTILVHSIGCGCDQFWQVVKSTPKSVTVRNLESIVAKRNIKAQTCDYTAKKDHFDYPRAEKRLGVKTDRRGEQQIGPVKRLMWWSVWDGKSRSQWSS